MAAFVYRFFPLEFRESKVQYFINLKKGSISVKEYSLCFTQLARYSPTMVMDSRARMTMFLSSVFENMFKECITTVL